MVYIPRSIYVAVVGIDIRLKCTFGQTLPKTTKVRWMKLNTRQHQNSLGSDAQKYEGGSMKSLSLEILSVTESDSGEYRCVGWNENGKNKFVDMQLMVGCK